MNLLKQIVILRQPGVYIILNESKKMCQILGSRNMLESVSNLLKKSDSREYGEMFNDMDDLDILVCEYTEDVRVMQSKWIIHYRNTGYSFYKESYLPEYKVKSNVTEVNGRMRYLVYLENKNKDIIIVGKFNNIEEGEKWKNEMYPNDIIKKVVYYKNK